MSINIHMAEVIPVSKILPPVFLLHCIISGKYLNYDDDLLWPLNEWISNGLKAVYLVWKLKPYRTWPQIYDLDLVCKFASVLWILDSKSDIIWYEYQDNINT